MAPARLRPNRPGGRYPRLGGGDSLVSDPGEEVLAAIRYRPRPDPDKGRAFVPPSPLFERLGLAAQDRRRLIGCQEVIGGAVRRHAEWLHTLGHRGHPYEDAQSADRPSAPGEVVAKRAGHVTYRASPLTRLRKETSGYSLLFSSSSAIRGPRSPAVVRRNMSCEILEV
jgi:hypothetical protein